MNRENINQVIEVLDVIFLLVFIAECVMKIIAYGFFASKNTYLRDVWNWLDFIVVVTGSFGLIMVIY
jgi:hypothetical protein